MGGTSILSSLAVARPGRAPLDRRIWLVQGRIQACMPQHVRIARRTLLFSNREKKVGKEAKSYKEFKFTVGSADEPAANTSVKKQETRSKDKLSAAGAEKRSSHPSPLDQSPHQHSSDIDTEHAELSAPSQTYPHRPRHGLYNILMCGSDTFSFAVFHRLLDDGACKCYRMVSPPLQEFEINHNVHRRVSPLLDWTEKCKKPHSFAPKDMAKFKLPEPFDQYNPDNVLLTASFGRLIPPSMMQNFEYCLNVHPSLLPDLPGADPITHAIAKRRTKTGVTVQTLGPTFDSGEVLAQVETPLPLNENYRVLHSKLRDIAGDLISAVMQDLPTFMARATPQSELAAKIPFSRAPKVPANFKRINWEKMSAGDIESRLRALPSPIPHLKTHLLRRTNQAGEAGTSEVRIAKCYPMSTTNYNFLLDHSQFGPQLRKLEAAPVGSATHFPWPRKHGGSEIPTGQGTLVFKCAPTSLHQPNELHIPELRRRRFLQAKLGGRTNSQIVLIKSPQYTIYKHPVEHLLCVSKLYKKNGFSPQYAKQWKNGYRKTLDPQEIFQFVTDPIVKKKPPREKRSDASLNDMQTADSSKEHSETKSIGMEQAKNEAFSEYSESAPIDKEKTNGEASSEDSATTSIGEEETDDDASGETDATSDDESAKYRHHHEELNATAEENRSESFSG